MNAERRASFASLREAKPGRLASLRAWGPQFLVPTFTLFFLAFAVLCMILAIVDLFNALTGNGELAEGMLKGLHTGVVALAVYELACVLQEEYETDGLPSDAIRRIRRGVTRFASIVFVALVLESLIMVIRYNQQALAGFLYYPVAIIASAALLLIALSVFIKLSTPLQNEAHAGAEAPAQLPPG